MKKERSSSEELWESWFMFDNASLDDETLRENVLLRSVHWSPTLLFLFSREESKVVWQRWLWWLEWLVQLQLMIINCKVMTTFSTVLYHQPARDISLGLQLIFLYQVLIQLNVKIKSRWEKLDNTDHVEDKRFMIKSEWYDSQIWWCG